MHRIYDPPHLHMPRERVEVVYLDLGNVGNVWWRQVTREDIVEPREDVGVGIGNVEDTLGVDGGELEDLVSDGWPC